jgi:hypothetical protein
MKRKYRTIAVVIFAVTVTAVVHATPSTQIWIPSTDIQGFGVVHLGWDSYIKTEANASLNGTVEPTITNGGITVGVLPFKKLGIEVGIDYRDISSNHQYPVYANCKVGMSEGAFFGQQPAIAAGGFDIGTKKGMTDYNVFYGLLAKNIWKLGRLSVGGYTGNSKLLVNLGEVNAQGNVVKDDRGLLLSWDRTMTELSGKIWLAVDYMGAKNGYGALSFGGAYSITPDASFIIGYDIYNDRKSYRPTVTFQVDINLPEVRGWFKKPEKP